MPVADVFHERLTVKSKYSKPLVAWRFQIDAAMAPWRMAFSGAVVGYFFVSSIVLPRSQRQRWQGVRDIPPDDPD